MPHPSVRAYLRLLCPWILIALPSLFPAAAQPPAASLDGKAIDSTQAPIAGAQVTAMRADGTVARTRTDPNGGFSLSLAPGEYVLKVTADGFAEAARTIRHTGQPAVLVAIELQVLPQKQAITITETPDYRVVATSSATKTPTALIDVPQSVSVVPQELMRDQMMMSIGDVVRYVPGITAIQGENNRDQVVIRGNSTSADFFVNGVRDDVQYYRDLYNVERVEALKGPNAMIFGRGGGGGVINRVTREAEFAPLREVVLQGGSFGNKRFTSDFDSQFQDRAAFRLNAMYENSGSFRRFVDLERYGINPTLRVMATRRTRLTTGYEHFRDQRTADRGIPSFAGRPADTPVSTYFGNPDNSRVQAGVNLGSAALEHQAGRLSIHSRVLIADYDRFYQNYVPGGVNRGKTLVALSAYNNATRRRNIFHQTDVSYLHSTGAVRHTLLWGFELGRQRSNNFRNTGYFNDGATSISVPYGDPVIAAAANFRQSATDADNRVRTNIAATYVQDQIELSRFVQVVAGVRFDRFDLNYHNNRTNENLLRLDRLVSPRAGLIFKPIAPLSIYSSYSVSWLPSSGDQFSSLTTITQQVKPEKFTNYEAGIKWNVRRGLSLTTAVYQLNRTNTRSTDPNDPTRIVQTGSQRSNGYELGWNGDITSRWRVAGGYGYQDAFITSATVAARTGAQVAQAPHHTFSLWNSYRFLPRLSGGLGILRRADMYAAVDNTVTLPGYTRADAAVYYSFTERVRLQANVENLLNRQYYINADGNNNISPGCSRAVRVGLIARL